MLLGAYVTTGIPNDGASVKGKGIPEVENTLGNHSMTVAPEVCDKWLAALNAQLAHME